MTDQEKELVEIKEELNLLRLLIKLNIENKLLVAENCELREQIESTNIKLDVLKKAIEERLSNA